MLFVLFLWLFFLFFIVLETNAWRGAFGGHIWQIENYLRVQTFLYLYKVWVCCANEGKCVMIKLQKLFWNF